MSSLRRYKFTIWLPSHPLPQSEYTQCWPELHSCVQLAACTGPRKQPTLWGDSVWHHVPPMSKRPHLYLPLQTPRQDSISCSALVSTIDNWQNVKHICICILPSAGTLSAGWTGVRALICYTTLLIEILPTDLCLGSGRIDHFFSHIAFKAIFF